MKLALRKKVVFSLVAMLSPLLITSSSVQKTPVSPSRTNYGSCEEVKSSDIAEVLQKILHNLQNKQQNPNQAPSLGTLRNIAKANGLYTMQTIDNVYNHIEVSKTPEEALLKANEYLEDYGIRVEVEDDEIKAEDRAKIPLTLKGILVALQVIPLDILRQTDLRKITITDASQYNAGGFVRQGNSAEYFLGPNSEEDSFLTSIHEIGHLLANKLFSPKGSFRVNSDVDERTCPAWYESNPPDFSYNPFSPDLNRKICNTEREGVWYSEASEECVVYLRRFRDGIDDGRYHRELQVLGSDYSSADSAEDAAQNWMLLAFPSKESIRKAQPDIANATEDPSPAMIKFATMVALLNQRVPNSLKYVLQICLTFDRGIRYKELVVGIAGINGEKQGFDHLHSSGERARNSTGKTSKALALQATTPALAKTAQARGNVKSGRFSR